MAELMPEAPFDSGTRQQPSIEPLAIEAWMRGSIPGVDPLLAPVLYSFQQAREDLARWTEGLTLDQLWATPHGFGSVGFHLLHIAGSTSRLMTYVLGEQLTAAQFAFLNSEHEPGGTREELIEAIGRAFHQAEKVVRSLDPSKLTEPRTVGRKKLPTTAIGLLVHIAEHTQRHVGQAISAAKWARIAS
ncbi:MAG TPA: DinB family protein [Bryobacteraceae bacterium]|nr:DinB family protein [Bryobacteraceae bacterium]